MAVPSVGDPESDDDVTFIRNPREINRSRSAHDNIFRRGGGWWNRTYYDASQEAESSQGRRGGGRRGGGSRAGREQENPHSIKEMKRICSSFESFDKGLLDEIVERVASASCKDLINLRLRKLSLDDVPLKILMRRTSKTFKTYDSFINKMFFSYEGSDAALPLLEKSSKGGHTATIYTFVILSIFLGGEYRRDEINIIGKIKLTPQQRKLASPCCTIKHPFTFCKNDLDGDEDELEEHCYSCSTDEKITKFYGG
ncbi:hypothetical protein H5410_004935 [Solanum commersonii]|uniref:Uncharacterized protein n=1 Tax=Solanum commersonii TaxID=4109 RepID=A0A9J6A582_SOLCO|nr:hypothetical protein H5410_004935 [Solanum commersonii]